MYKDIASYQLINGKFKIENICIKKGQTGIFNHYTPAISESYSRILIDRKTHIWRENRRKSNILFQRSGVLFLLVLAQHVECL